MKYSRFHFALLVSCAAVTAALAGCTHTPPAVGTWTGGIDSGNASLTLAPDGSGKLSVPLIRLDKAVKWKEDEDKVNLTLDTAGQTKSGGEVTALLSSDKKTMTVSFPMKSLTLTKQEAAK